MSGSVSRRLGATVVALGAGAAGFAALLLADYVLYLRLRGAAPPAGAAAVAALLAMAGLYAGWILGMLVFSAIRGSDGDGSA